MEKERDVLLIIFTRTLENSCCLNRSIKKKHNEKRLRGSCFSRIRAKWDAYLTCKFDKTARDGLALDSHHILPQKCNRVFDFILSCYGGASMYFVWFSPKQNKMLSSSRLPYTYTSYPISPKIFFRLPTRFQAISMGMDVSSIFLKIIFPLVGSVLGWVMAISPINAIKVNLPAFS